MNSKVVIFIISTLSLSIASRSSFSQSVYLNMTREKVVELLNEREIEIMDSDNGHIHSVDDRLYRNLIMYFEDGYCYKVITTFQEPESFMKMLGFLRRRYKEVGKMCWILPMESGKDVVIAYRETGFDVIEEEFHSDTSTKK